MVSYLGTPQRRDLLDRPRFLRLPQGRTPDKIVETVMTKLDKLGKGIVLMHDFQKHTGEALPTLLARLKAGGYKIVQIKAKTTFQSLPEYDEAVLKELKVPRPLRARVRSERGADGLAVLERASSVRRVMAGLSPGHLLSKTNDGLPIDAVAMQLATMRRSLQYGLCFGLSGPRCPLRCRPRRAGADDAVVVVAGQRAARSKPPADDRHISEPQRLVPLRSPAWARRRRRGAFAERRPSRWPGPSTGCGRPPEQMRKPGPWRQPE